MTGVSEYSTVAVLILAVIGLTTVIMILTHAIGPRRHGQIKDTVYESGAEPIGDARRRFNVRFYLVAVLFLVFDVEIIFLYPWAALFPRLSDPAHQEWAAALSQAGYGPGFFLVTIAVFFSLLTIGFVYEWRRGVFRWD